MTRENIDAITSAMRKFLDEARTQKSFNLANFKNLMDEKFLEQGYRNSRELPLNQPTKVEILILQDGAAGDLILSTGVVREIRRLYPDATIRMSVLDLRTTVSLCASCPYTDEIIVNGIDLQIWRNILESFSYYIEFSRKFLEQRTDICYSFTHNPVTNLLMYMSGAKVRIAPRFDDDSNTKWPALKCGLPYDYVNIFSTRPAPTFLYGDHQVDWAMSLLDSQLGAPVAKRHPEIWCQQKDFDAAKKILHGKSEKIYALCMGGSQKCKRYPPEKYARLVELILAEEPDATFLILGGGDWDIESSEKFFAAIDENLKDHITDLTEKLLYPTVGAVLNFCHMYIGNDFGTMHMAAALEIPCLEVSAFAADLPASKFDSIRMYRPYNVPNVIVQPKNALPECLDEEKSYTSNGCKEQSSHCIAQIEPETILRGFHLLKQRAESNLKETLYIS